MDGRAGTDDRGPPPRGSPPVDVDRAAPRPRWPRDARPMTPCPPRRGGRSRPRARHRAAEGRPRLPLTRHPELEPLEGRSLRSGITEYPIPTGSTNTQDVAAGPDGAI